MKVAVTTDEPALPKSNWLPEIATTDVAADAYNQVPVAAVVATVGAVMLAFASPYVASTLAHVNVGVALATVSVAVTDVVKRFTVSVGMKVAVMVDEPPPATVPVAPLNVATESRADAYVHVPATDAPLNVAVGLVSVNGASP